MKTNNGTAAQFVADTIKSKHSKSWDVCYHWLTEHQDNGDFSVYCDAGKNNLDNNHTKHHSLTHHQNVRKKYILQNFLNKKFSNLHLVSVPTEFIPVWRHREGELMTSLTWSQCECTTDEQLTKDRQTDRQNPLYRQSIFCNAHKISTGTVPYPNCYRPFCNINCNIEFAETLAHVARSCINDNFFQI